MNTKFNNLLTAIYVRTSRVRTVMNQNWKIAYVVPVLIGKQFPHENEWDGGESDGVADHEDDEADERQPLEILVSVHGLEVEERADGAGGESHDQAGEDEEDPATGLVHKEDGDYRAERSWENISLLCCNLGVFNV